MTSTITDADTKPDDEHARTTSRRTVTSALGAGVSSVVASGVGSTIGVGVDVGDGVTAFAVGVAETEAVLTTATEGGVTAADGAPPAHPATSRATAAKGLGLIPLAPTA